MKVLDADDQLTPGALGRDIAAMNEPRVGWAASRVLDLNSNGECDEHFDKNPRGGRMKSGTIYANWQQLKGAGDVLRTHDRSMVVHPATLCVRSWLLLALGGWMALPASEDTGLLLALDAVSDGWFNAEVGLLYRQWPGQVSATAEHIDETELMARRNVIEARAVALGELIGFW